MHNDDPSFLLSVDAAVSLYRQYLIETCLTVSL